MKDIIVHRLLPTFQSQYTFHIRIIDGAWWNHLCIIIAGEFNIYYQKFSKAEVGEDVSRLRPSYPTLTIAASSFSIYHHLFS